MVSRAKTSLFRRTVTAERADPARRRRRQGVVVDAYASAMKAKIEQKPIVMVLAGDRLAPLGELAQAIDEHRRRNPGLTDVLLPVPVDIRDWSARIPANAPGLGQGPARRPQEPRALRRDANVSPRSTATVFCLRL